MTYQQKLLAQQQARHGAATARDTVTIGLDCSGARLVVRDNACRTAVVSLTRESIAALHAALDNADRHLQFAELITTIEKGHAHAVREEDYQNEN